MMANRRMRDMFFDGDGGENVLHGMLRGGPQRFLLPRR